MPTDGQTLCRSFLDNGIVGFGQKPRVGLKEVISRRVLPGHCFTGLSSILDHGSRPNGWIAIDDRTGGIDRWTDQVASCDPLFPSQVDWTSKHVANRGDAVRQEE